MNDTLALLERARARCNPPTWYRLAKELGVSTARMSNWTRGVHHPDIAAAWKIADFLGEDRTDVLAVIMAETHRGAPQADFWERLTPRVLPAALVALTLAAGGQGRPPRGFSEGPKAASELTPVYIMRSGLKYLRVWLTRLRRSTPSASRIRAAEACPA